MSNYFRMYISAKSFQLIRSGSLVSERPGWAPKLSPDRGRRDEQGLKLAELRLFLCNKSCGDESNKSHYS
jgi:hypothetical protein